MLHCRPKANFLIGLSVYLISIGQFEQVPGAARSMGPLGFYQFHRPINKFIRQRKDIRKHVHSENGETDSITGT